MFEIKERGQLPEGRWDHVAVYHENAIIIWGGSHAASHVDYYISGKWSRIETTGAAPRYNWTMKNKVQVVNGKMIYMDAQNIFALDLKTWIWEKLIQSGNQPLKSAGMALAWLH